MTEPDKNEDGELVDEDGDVLYCDNSFCSFPAIRRVAVSENSAHDSTRDLCASCEEVYTIGVQHGRFHEAALFDCQPGRDSAQDAPEMADAYLAIQRILEETGGRLTDHTHELITQLIESVDFTQVEIDDAT
jgi:hypothetical protein